MFKTKDNKASKFIKFILPICENSLLAIFPFQTRGNLSAIYPASCCRLLLRAI